MNNKRLLVAAIGLVGIGIIGAAIYWANQPAEVRLSKNNTNVDVKGEAISLEPFTADSFSTRIIDTLKLKTSTENATAAITGQYLFTDKSSSSGDQLAITIGSATTRDVSGISLAKFRMIHPDDYDQVSAPSLYPAGAVVFVKRQGYEKSVFWIEGNRYASVVVSGGTEHAAQLDTILQTTLQNWQWR